MINILVRKLTSLGRDENGAVLMVTLALFLFMYLSGAGVFAIGKVVKDRVHLQNACDAAAYSAAVVQADTLSRIATINRAMAWTYVSMTRRQMDYIVDKWLKNVAKFAKDDDTISLNTGRGPYSGWYLGETVASYHDHLSRMEESFFPSLGIKIKEQIVADKETIDEMSKKCKDLRENLIERVEKVARKILEANVATGDRVLHRWCISCTNNFMEDEENEAKFIKYVGATLDNPLWFPKPKDRLGRKFDANEDLVATIMDSLGAIKDVVRASSFRHGDDCYDAPYNVRPLKLKSNYFREANYFGEAGTITVGLAKYNENPWYRILKTKTDTGGILKGIFAAFNPYRFVEWTWAFSSAKAGYKASGDGKREYRIHGNTDGDWNLCVNDWDAVFVPVRRAVSTANTGGEWDYSKPPLGDWIESGSWKPLSGSSVTYSVSNMPDLPWMDTRYGADGSLDWDKIAEMLYH